MGAIDNQHTVLIKVFSFLRQFMDRQGMPYEFEKEIPEQGISAYELARALQLPPEKIEAVFCNGRIINIYDHVFPGNRIAFCPFGTPGPHRVFLGMIKENRKRKRIEVKNPVLPQGILLKKKP